MCICYLFDRKLFLLLIRIDYVSEDTTSLFFRTLSSCLLTIGSYRIRFPFLDLVVGVVILLIY